LPKLTPKLLEIFLDPLERLAVLRHHKQVEVAAGALLASGSGPENDGLSDAAGLHEGAPEAGLLAGKGGGLRIEEVSKGGDKGVVLVQ
jgi:hypothetical protein